MRRAAGCNRQELVNRVKTAGKGLKALTDGNKEVSEALLQRLRSGKYPYVVTENRRKAILEILPGDEDSLFPYEGKDPQCA